MDKISEALGSTIKEKVIGKISNEKVGPSKENSSTLLKIISKNFMSISAMARDLNVASQNVKQLVELMGGKPSSKEDKVAGSGLTENERERKLQVLMEKETEAKPTPIPKEEEKKPSLMKKAFEKFKSTKIGKKTTGKLAELKKSFDPGKILKSLTKYLALGALIGVIFVSFKDSFVEWASELWETIKESFDKFVDTIKNWFKEVVQPIFEKIGGFIDEWIIQPIKSFFGGFTDFIKSYFETLYGLITDPIETVKNIWEKFKSVIDSAIQKIADFYNSMNDKNPVKILANKLMPEAVKKALEERGKKAAGEVGDEAEKKKLERQQAEVLETQRVKKLEEEKQYKGDDEIVRARLGLPPKTETMRREEAAKEVKPVEPAPKPEPIVVPSPVTPEPKPAAIAKEPAKAPPTPPPPTAAAPSPEAKPPAAAESKPAKVGSESGKKAMIGAMDQAKISDPTARAAIMAQVGHESGGFTTLSENLNYKSSTLMKLFPKKFSGPDDAQQVASGGPQKVAERLYGGRMGNAPEGSGEGFMYRGRGFIQLTGKQNYTKFGYANDPEKLTKPEGAAESAIKYMMGYKGDWSDVKAVTKFVNGGYIGLADRQKHFEEYLNDPSIIKVGAVTTATSGGGVSSASTDLASNQRSQAKSQTPVIVNAPTTNTSVIKKTEVASKSEPSTGASTLVARAA